MTFLSWTCLGTDNKKFKSNNSYNDPPQLVQFVLPTLVPQSARASFVPFRVQRFPTRRTRALACSATPSLRARKTWDPWDHGRRSAHHTTSTRVRDSTVSPTDSTLSHTDSTVSQTDSTLSHTDSTVSHTDSIVSHTDSTVSPIKRDMEMRFLPWFFH